MQLFIWTYVGDLTTNYHSGGSAVVVAASVDRARELIAANCPADCSALNDAPDKIYALDGQPAEEIFIFADAGCC